MRPWSAVLVAVMQFGCAQSRTPEPDALETLLGSPSRVEQRSALNAILARPRDYVPRLQQLLREYPNTLGTNWTAATRAAHVAALVRDSSFAPILAGILGDSAVLGDCIYSCPAIFALSLHAEFGGWTPPPTLDTTLTTVTDLHVDIAHRTSLAVRPIDSMAQGPFLERNRTAIEGKSEEELIRMAGDTSHRERAALAVYALSGSVTTSRNLTELYLLLMDDDRNDASRERRGAIYEAIHRAETARARGQ